MWIYHRPLSSYLSLVFVWTRKIPPRNEKNKKIYIYMGLYPGGAYNRDEKSVSDLMDL